VTVLVLGASGQLATHLKKRMPDASCHGRATLDLADLRHLAAAIKAIRPSIIVNAAAYTAVDRAESEPELAWRINAEAVAIAARTAAELDVPMLQVSTDYVFDGRKQSAYLVDDAVGPTNVYGVTKLAAELAVRTLCHKHWILRTSWLFSEYSSNFVKTMIRSASTQRSLRVVADQHGRPTYADDLADLIAQVVRGPYDALPYGTHHAVGGPAVSWYAFAEAIFAVAERHGLVTEPPSVVPISSADYPSAARRPANSVLDANAELMDVFGTGFDWTRGLEIALRRLADRTRGAG
jgi:dTDP-4-dehydrorhamnose reductase